MATVKFYPNNSLPGSQGSIKYITQKTCDQINENQRIIDELRKKDKEICDNLSGIAMPMDGMDYYEELAELFREKKWKFYMFLIVQP